MTATVTTELDVAVVEIPVDLIDFDPENTGRTDLDDDFVADIRERGVDSPIAVTAEEGGRYRLIYGERRTRGSIAAERTTIPAVIKQPDTEADRIEMQGVENLQRADLHPLDEGHLFVRLSDAGRLQQQIADKFAKGSQPYVSKRMSLWRGLTDDAKQLFRDGYLNVKEAEALAQLHDRPTVVADLLDIARTSELGPNPHIPEWMVRQALDEQARVKAVESARRKLKKAGVRILTDDEYRGDDVSHLGNENMFDVDVDVEAHAAEPCHAAHVQNSGAVVLVCTDADRHRPSGESTVKATNLRDLTETLASDAQDDAPPDDAAQPTPPVEQDTHPHRNDRGPIVDLPEPTRSKPTKASKHDDAPPDSGAGKGGRFAAMRAAVRGTRSHGAAIAIIGEQLVADVLVDEVDVMLGELLDLDRDVAQGDAVRAYVDAGGDNPLRFLAALGMALGERRLADRLQHGGDVDALTRRSIRHHLDQLAKHGHTATDVEAALIVEPEPEPELEPDPPAPEHTSDDVSAPDMPRAYSGSLTRVRLDALRVLAFADATTAFEDVRLSTYSTDKFEGADVELVVLSQAAGWLIDNGLAERTASKSARITDAGREVARDEDVLAGIELPDPLAAVAAGFLDARDQLEASGKSDKRRPSLIDRAADARNALAATLILRHPDREQLAGGLQALADDVTTDTDARHAELVALLEQGGPIGDLRQVVRVERRPKTRVSGLLRDVYVEDLQAALDEHGGVDLAAIAEWQATHWPDMAEQTDDEALAWFNEHRETWGEGAARIAYLVETANAGVAWDHRPKVLIAIKSRIPASAP